MEAAVTDKITAAPEMLQRGTAPPCGDVRVAVLGATGYAGAELVRLLTAHPGASVAALGSRGHAGRSMARVWPSLPHVGLVLEDDQAHPEAWRDRGVEVVFAALPHGAFASRAEAFLRAGMRVVDLSSDFRLRSAPEYRARYGQEHPAPHLLERSIYGLTEWCGPELAGAQLVANPGCYATAVLLAILPAAEAGWWGPGALLVNAISGVSGAGRAPELATHFIECGNSAAPYKVGEAHAHLGEIRQAVARAAPAHGEILLNPHLVPMARGILASAAMPLAHPIQEDAARALYRARYADQPFVRLLEGDELPETRHVRGSNRCDLAVRVVASGKMLLVFAALDNLIKGAAGQALQNWNRMQGWPEETGLPLAGWACA